MTEQNQERCPGCEEGRCSLPSVYNGSPLFCGKHQSGQPHFTCGTSIGQECVKGAASAAGMMGAICMGCGEKVNLQGVCINCDIPVEDTKGGSIDADLVTKMMASPLVQEVDPETLEPSPSQAEKSQSCFHMRGIQNKETCWKCGMPWQDVENESNEQRREIYGHDQPSQAEVEPLSVVPVLSKESISRSLMILDHIEQNVEEPNITWDHKALATIRQLQRDVGHFKSHYEAAQAGWDGANDHAEKAEATIRQLQGEVERLNKWAVDYYKEQRRAWLKAKSELAQARKERIQWNDAAFRKDKDIIEQRERAEKVEAERDELQATVGDLIKVGNKHLQWERSHGHPSGVKYWEGVVLNLPEAAKKHLEEVEGLREKAAKWDEHETEWKEIMLKMTDGTFTIDDIKTPHEENKELKADNERLREELTQAQRQTIRTELQRDGYLKVDETLNPNPEPVK